MAELTALSRTQLSGSRGLAQGGYYLLGAPHTADSREDGPEGEGMLLGRPRRAGVLDEDLLVPTLVGVARSALHPEIGRDATEDDRTDPPPPELQVEVGAVEGSPLALAHDVVAGLGPSSGTISSHPGGGLGQGTCWSVTGRSPSRPSAEGPTCTRATKAPQARQARATSAALATTEAASYGAVGIPTMPFWRSMTTSSGVRRAQVKCSLGHGASKVSWLQRHIRPLLEEVTAAEPRSARPSPSTWSAGPLGLPVPARSPTVDQFLNTGNCAGAREPMG